MRLIIVLVFFALAVDGLGQIPGEQFLKNSTFRIKSIKTLRSDGLSVLDSINEKTTNITAEQRFFYDEDRVVRIETKNFSNRGEFLNIEVDSIVYVLEDSVLIYSSKDSYKDPFKRKLLGIKKFLLYLPRNGTSTIYSQFHKVSAKFQRKNGIIVKVWLDANDRMDPHVITFDKQRRVASMLYDSGRVWLRWHYKSPNHFEKAIGSGRMWWQTNSYFLNVDGCLIKQVNESDTNPNFILYEYETGKGNGIEFTYTIYNLVDLDPLIY